MTNWPMIPDPTEAGCKCSVELPMTVRIELDRITSQKQPFAELGPIRDVEREPNLTIEEAASFWKWDHGRR